MLLDGKKIIVTGGLTGLGRESVLACVEHGAKVVSMSRKSPDHEQAVALVEEAKKRGSNPVRHIAVDVADEAKVPGAFDEAAEWLGGLDCLVNCAGLEQQIPAELVTRKDVQGMLDVHLMGTIFTNQAAFKYMKDSGGSIVNHASYAGVVGMPGMPAYSAAKGGVISFSRNIAKDWGKYMIRVNVACPSCMSPLLQEFIDEMGPEQFEGFKAWLATEIPLGGWVGTAEQCAGVSVFLASDLSSFVHGQLMAADGGMIMSR